MLALPNREGGSVSAKLPRDCGGEPASSTFPINWNSGVRERGRDSGRDELQRRGFDREETAGDALASMTSETDIAAMTSDAQRAAGHGGPPRANSSKLE